MKVPFENWNKKMLSYIAIQQVEPGWTEQERCTLVPRRAPAHQHLQDGLFQRPHSKKEIRWNVAPQVASDYPKLASDSIDSA